MPWHHWEKAYYSQAQGMRVTGHQQAPLLQVRLVGPRPSLLTSSNLKVESLLTCWVASGKSSGQREAYGG